MSSSCEWFPFQVGYPPPATIFYPFLYAAGLAVGQILDAGPQYWKAHASFLCQNERFDDCADAPSGKMMRLQLLRGKRELMLLGQLQASVNLVDWRLPKPTADSLE